METKISFRHKGPHLGLLALVFMVLFCTGLSFVVSVAGEHFPAPFESAPVIIRFFQNQSERVLMCAFFQFCSAIPLGIFTATIVSRFSFLGSTAAGNNIALFGGFLTAFNIAISSMLMWVMTCQVVAGSENIILALYFMVFIIGGIGYSVPLGLLLAGISIQSWFAKTLPRWLIISGIILALFGELSTLFIVFPKLLFLIPLTRFPAFIWMIITGFKLPVK